MSALSVLVIFALIAGILLSIETGYRIGLRYRPRVPESARSVSAALVASIFSLMGLLIAFTFYAAASRFDIRRNLIVEEANAIGTAYLRLDLVPPEAQPKLREDFREYLGSRLAFYQAIRSQAGAYERIWDVEALQAGLSRSEVLQREIWRNAVMAARTINPGAQSLVLSSINQMIDITTARTVALAAHMPPPVFAMLLLTVAVSSVLAGYTMSASAVRDWPPIIIFILVLSAAVYIIVDYEYPRIGLIRIDPVDQVLVETLEKMK